MKRFVFSLLSIILFVFAVAPASAQISLLSKGQVTLRTTTGDHVIQVEIAEQPDQRMIGLMFRRKLEPDAGMLFVYRRPQRIELWMQNTFIPLDIIFADAQGRVIGFAERTVPLSRSIIQSPGPTSAALELNAGTIARIGLRKGDLLILPQPKTAP